MATKSETRDRAANELGILRLGQTLQDQDKVRIESGYDEVYENLNEQGLAIWATTGEVPTKLVPYVVSLVADNCLNTYQVSEGRYRRIKLTALTAVREIRRLVQPEFESVEPMRDF